MDELMQFLKSNPELVESLTKQMNEAKGKATDSDNEEVAKEDENKVDEVADDTEVPTDPEDPTTDEVADEQDPEAEQEDTLTADDVVPDENIDPLETNSPIETPAMAEDMGPSNQHMLDTLLGALSKIDVSKIPVILSKLETLFQVIDDKFDGLVLDTPTETELEDIDSDPKTTDV